MQKLLRIMFSFLLFCSVVVSAQQQGDLIKAALLYKFTEHIQWPPSSNPNFTIAIYGDSNVYQSLKGIDGKRVNKKVIKRLNTQNLAQLADVEMLFVPKQFNDRLSEITAALRGKSVLVVSEESDNKTNIMINLVLDNNTIKFQVNRPNIIAARLTLDSDLLLLGGTELDVVKIYREMQSSLESSQRLLETSEQNLATTQKKVSSVNLELAALNSKMTENQRQFNEQKKAFNSAQAELKAKTTEIEQKNKELADILTQQQKLQADIKNLSESLTVKQQELSERQSNYDLLSQAVNKSESELKILEHQIEEKNAILFSQTTELTQQQTKIEQQNKAVITALVVLAITVIAMTFIITLFIKIKRINKELNLANSHLKLTQNQLIESEKFAALGQLVAGVAHELNTPIGIAITSASFIEDESRALRRKLNDKGLRKSDLEGFLDNLDEAEAITNKNLNRCADMIQSFKLVAADQAIAEVRTINLRDYIHEVMTTLAVSLKRTQVDWELTGDTADVTLDPGILSQVINNIVMNAINHAFADCENKKITLTISKNIKQAKLIISDNGCGMDEETLTQLFDPFFTTKRGEGGTGLGMNIVYNLVVQNLKGSVEATSKINQGTQVVLTLPLAEQKLHLV